MALSKEEVRNAFREVALREYADVPPAEEIDHVFSERFLSSMAALIEEEKRGSWRLLSQQRRRALVVAAILAAALLLTACTPKLREAVTEFVVSIYERFVDYGSSTFAHEEIESIYAPTPIPEGFWLVSQEQYTPYFVKTVYQNQQGVDLVVEQAVSKNYWGSIDREQGEFTVLTENAVSVLLYTSDTLTTASWTCDGYYMKLRFFSQLSTVEVETLIASISPTE